MYSIISLVLLQYFPFNTSFAIYFVLPYKYDCQDGSGLGDFAVSVHYFAVLFKVLCLTFGICNNFVY